LGDNSDSQLKERKKEGRKERKKEKEISVLYSYSWLLLMM
jgi:hypothetical protein